MYRHVAFWSIRLVSLASSTHEIRRVDCNFIWGVRVSTMWYDSALPDHTWMLALSDS